jgi:putative copper resistance protein D
MAVGAVLVLLAAGLSQTVLYVGSIGGLFGTGYGIMVVSKVVLLALALLLGGWNNVLVRRLGAGAGELPPSRVRWLVETEIGVVVAVLLAAASLTSLPPAIDVREDRATLSEVAARFQPRVPRLSSPPITELLATAAPITEASAPRQPAEYAWSEYNHHTAGLFVLAMGLLASFERGRRRSWARHWPLLLFGLAAFMFVRNDPRAWPLGPAGFWETLLLPDVLQHRISVALVVALGAVEWLVRAGRLRSARWAYVFPLLCLAGGALLLTHSHAMFNLKAEFLTEVAHTPLGVLGVVLGCSRWLQLRLPPPDNRLPGHVWAAAMVIMGLILTFYREG